MATTIEVHSTGTTAGLRRGARSGRRSRIGIVLGSLQGVLGLLFLMTGSMKLFTPADVLMAQMGLPLPLLFVRFLGLAELLGAVGLVLPSLLRIRPLLTPVAAVGLVIIMSGATVTTLLIGGGATALMPLVIGLLAGYVAYGRLRLAPQTSR